MVGIKYLFIALTFSLFTLDIAAQNPTGTFVERQLRQLSIRSERIATELEEANTVYLSSPSPELAATIQELERQLATINQTIERLSTPKPAPKAEEKREEIATPSAEEEPKVESSQTEEVVEEPTKEQPTEVEQQEPTEETTEKPFVEPEPAVEEPTKEQSAPQESNEERIVVSNEIKELFATTTRRYALIESEIDTLIAEYGKVYTSILGSIEEYEKATSLATLNDHYANYTNSVEQSRQLANTIADRADMLFASKTNTYLMFADTLGLSALRSDFLHSSEQMESSMAEKLASRCTDLDVAMYPHRLRSTIELEAHLSRHLAPEIADSLLTRAEQFDTTYTLFTPWNEPERSNVDFKAVTIKKNSKERAVSSLPTLKIPSKGELYSITVANYASLPPSTKVFRGATPLYRERREDGRTYVYIGLYPTALSAQEDIALLRKVGFKQPTLVMWRDGIRRDDFVDRNSTPATPKAAMWRVEISGATTVLPAEALAVIREKAPRKEISKFNDNTGATLYTIGIFTKESEAKALAAAIESASTTLSTKVVQLGKR